MEMHDLHEPLSVRDSDATDSRFTNARLAMSRFDDVNLQGSAFTNVNLSGATFVDINLSNVSITDANLGGMKINGVLVSDLIQAHENRAKWMPTAFHAGAVVYVKNLEFVQAFYQTVLGLDVGHIDDDHVVLASPTFQLVVLRMPERIASTVEIERPPRRRTETPIKLVFAVASLAATRALASQQGGELLPPEREWDFQGWRVCDGHDPEGNIVQFRENRS